MDAPPPLEPEPPPCEPIADTGGICLLPFPRHYTPRGSPFRVPPVSYLYISSRATQSVRRKFMAFAARLTTASVRAQINSDSHLAPFQAVFTDSAQFPKWVHFDAVLRGEAAHADGYKISVNQDGILLHANDEDGVQYMCDTLQQLIEDGPDIPGMDLEDYPIMPYRAVHFDFKGWPPAPAWLKSAIDMLASVKINVVIFEYEAHYDYASIPGLAAEGALTPAEVQELVAYAKNIGVSLIPLLSCVGNASHVLSKPEYASLREHPDYPHMFNLSNPDTLNFLMAQLNELLPLHPGKMIHIGGDGAFLLGGNPATQQRAEELGGADAVYLEYMGAISRYLVSQGIQPLLWDELVRGMSDEQIKWLPSEAVLVFWLPEGLSPASAPEVLAHLERYKLLGRTVWGSVQLSPSRQYNAFDQVDAWADFGELNAVKGLIATVRAREYAKGGLLPPFESVWPAVLYAAGRAWSGVHTIARELFPQRFVARMFNLRALDSQSRLWAGFDRCLAGNPAGAIEYFKAEARNTPKNPATALFMESWASVTAFLQLFQELETEFRDNFVNIQNGAADPLLAAQLRWRAHELKARAPELIATFSERAAPMTGELAVHEFIESSLAYTLRRLDDLEPLLAVYPLPAEEFREPVGL